MLKEHPMPKNTLFTSEEEAYRDLTRSSGIITAESNMNDEFVNWYGEFICMLQ